MNRLAKHRWAARLALLCGSTVLTVAAAEVALRFLRPSELATDGRSLQQQLADSERSTPDRVETVSLRGLIRASANPRLIYELKPGLDTKFQNAPLAINEQGYRGPSRPRTRGQGTFRILGLGDSVLFGWGVRWEESFLAVLERGLDERFPGRRHEVLNFGVPGYNTMQEAELLESVGLEHQPDLVLLCFVPNDDQLPGFVRRDDGSLLESMMFYKLVSRGQRLLGESLTRSKGEVLTDEQVVPKQYVSMVGPESVRHGLSRIAYLGQRHGFPVAVFCFRGGNRELTRQVREWCHELGVRFLDLDAYLEPRGLRYDEHQLSERDMHPDARLHTEIGKFLLESLPLEAFAGAVPP